MNIFLSYKKTLINQAISFVSVCDKIPREKYRSDCKTFTEYVEKKYTLIVQCFCLNCNANKISKNTFRDFFNYFHSNSQKRRGS